MQSAFFEDVWLFCRNCFRLLYNFHYQQKTFETKKNSFVHFWQWIVEGYVSGMHELLCNALRALDVNVFICKRLNAEMHFWRILGKNGGTNRILRKLLNDVSDGGGRKVCAKKSAEFMSTWRCIWCLMNISFPSFPSHFFYLLSTALKMPGSPEKLQPSSHTHSHVFFILF